MLLEHLQKRGFCKPDGPVEDLDVAICLAKLNIYPEDTKDEEGKITFHSVNPYPLLAGDPTLSQVYRYSKNNVTFGYKHVSFIQLMMYALFHYVIQIKNVYVLLALADPSRTPSRVNFLHFHAVFGKILAK